MHYISINPHKIYDGILDNETRNFDKFDQYQTVITYTHNDIH